MTNRPDSDADASDTNAAGAGPEDGNETDLLAEGADRTEIPAVTKNPASRGPAASQILSSQAMKSIVGSVPQVNLGFVLSPATRKLIEGVNNFAMTLPKMESITSSFPTFRGVTGLEGGIGKTLAASILPSSKMANTLASTTSLIDSLNLPAIASMNSRAFSVVKNVEALGLNSFCPAWIDSLSAGSAMSSLLPWIDWLVSAQKLPSFDALRGLNTGFLNGFNWITELTRGLKLSKPHLPPNWRAVALEPDDIEDDVRAILEDGIPLAWVPSARVVELLLAAPDARARRRIISNNHRGILSHCEDVIGRLPIARALLYVDMTRKAILALRDGHVEAAQSLATNVLDTLVSQYSKAALGVKPGVLTNTSSYQRFKRQSWRLTLAVHPVTTVMSGRYTLDDRPGGYRRNATAHAITRHQYNRINAVLAIMNATSLLVCFARETPAFE